MTNKELSEKVNELEKIVKKLVDVCSGFAQKYVDFAKKFITEFYEQQKHQEQPHHEFKVGDRVQFKSWEEMQEIIKKYPENSKEFIKNVCGKFAIIENIQLSTLEYSPYTKPELYVNILDENNKETMYFNSHVNYPIDLIKPATDEPKCKFKVGDKVKNVGNKDNHYNKVGIVEKCMGFAKEVNTNIYIIKFDDLDPIEHSLQYECDLESYTEPRWTFTDDEKVILRNLPEDYKWIVRDMNGAIKVTNKEPHKDHDLWLSGFGSLYIYAFNHLFQSIKWEDDEACEFRKFI